MLEKIRSKSFDMSEFKELTAASPKGSREAMQYAAEHLEQIGRGTARAVFLLNSRHVLKVAMNVRGDAQNEAEVDVATNPRSALIFAKVREFDPQYKWLVSELVRPIESPLEFQSLTGMNFRKFTEALLDMEYGDSLEKAVAYYHFPKENLGMLKAVADTVQANKLMIADLEVVDHWGKTPDGRVVLLDYGYTREVFKKHY